MVTKEEYLRLIEEAMRQEGDDLEDIDCSAWIPAESPLKKKIPERFGSIDATKLKREAIKKALPHCQQVTVGKFLVTIPDRDEGANKQPIYEIRVFETKYKTPSGRPCNMQYKVNLIKDSRFEKRAWLSYFAGFDSSSGRKIPEETLLDIIKWLQAITKLTCFL